MRLCELLCDAVCCNSTTTSSASAKIKAKQYPEMFLGKNSDGPPGVRLFES